MGLNLVRFIIKQATVNDLFKYSKISQWFYSEKLHIHFCKYILGVHKKTNFAVTSELARYPIQVTFFQPFLPRDGPGLE